MLQRFLINLGNDQLTWRCHFQLFGLALILLRLAFKLSMKKTIELYKSRAHDSYSIGENGRTNILVSHRFLLSSVITSAIFVNF